MVLLVFALSSWNVLGGCMNDQLKTADTSEARPEAGLYG
ncbi:putative lipoprotein [Synechococcus sp. BIOS-U3-1]|nr:putative lipoprotein [Synechococcus sp. BIOS-U3-1]